jgi:hypothetical protein
MSFSLHGLNHLFSWSTVIQRRRSGNKEHQCPRVGIPSLPSHSLSLPSGETSTPRRDEQSFRNFSERIVLHILTGHSFPLALHAHNPQRPHRTSGGRRARFLLPRLSLRELYGGLPHQEGRHRRTLFLRGLEQKIFCAARPRPVLLQVEGGLPVRSGEVDKEPPHRHDRVSHTSLICYLLPSQLLHDRCDRETRGAASQSLRKSLFTTSVTVLSLPLSAAN